MTEISNAVWVDWSISIHRLDMQLKSSATSQSGSRQQIYFRLQFARVLIDKNKSTKSFLITVSF